MRLLLFNGGLERLYFLLQLQNVLMRFPRRVRRRVNARFVDAGRSEGHAVVVRRFVLGNRTRNFLNREILLDKVALRFAQRFNCVYWKIGVRC